MDTPSQIVKAIKANIIEMQKADPRGDPVYDRVCVKGTTDASACFFRHITCRRCPLGQCGDTSNLDIIISALEKIE